ncbi:MAG: hypothetical protein RLZZ196_3033 [Bacteroidota bacterium]|jgi:hypothetical protein
MDTDKLLKAIQILIKEELKQQLPTLIKESVRAEMKKMLAESKQPVAPKNTGLSMAKAILGDDTEMQTEITNKVDKQFSKNPMINQILNETKGGIPQGDGGFRTMNFGQGDMGSIVGRTAVAEKMGYGEFAGGGQKTGLGVQTGVPELDKALNRDYSELVKKFKK